MSREIHNIESETIYRFAKLEQACFALGIHLFIVEGDRPDEKQAERYAQGRTAPGPIVTHAKPRQSWHSTRKGGLPASRAICLGIRKTYPDDPQKRPDYHSWDDRPPEATMKLIADMAIHIGFEAGYYWPGEKKDPMHIEFHPGFVRLSGIAIENQIKDYCEGKD